MRVIDEYYDNSLEVRPVPRYSKAGDSFAAHDTDTVIMIEHW